MKQLLYRLIVMVFLISSIGLVNADHCCRNFVPEFLAWLSKLSDEEIAIRLNKDVDQMRQPMEHNQLDQNLLQHINPILLRAYLLSKQGKLASDVYAELDELFTIIEQNAGQDDADSIALQKALNQDLEDQLKRYQAGQITQSEIEDYIERLYDWWNQEEGQEDQEDLNDDWDDYWNEEDGDEDWGNDNQDEKEIDPAADALLGALNSRESLQDDFPPAPALLEDFKK